MVRSTIGWAARLIVLGSVVLLVGATTLYAGGHTVRLNQPLNATSAAPAAHGRARLKVQSSANGKFNVVATHLSRDRQYDLIIGGVKVGVLQANHGGNGRARFSTRPGTKDALLGFDPRGAQVIVRDQDTGDDVLVGEMPSDDDNDAGETACCIANGHDGESEVECEEMSPEECTAEGGTPLGVPGGTAAACLPNPCATTPPPAGSVTCCTNETHDDESEAECKSVATEAACADDDGTVVQAPSCDPNPCAVTPPSNRSACCIPEDGDGGDTECEVLSAEACTADGGTINSAANCDGSPCGPGDDGGGGDDDGGGGDD